MSRLAGGGLRNIAITQLDLPVADILKPRDGSQQGGLATTGRAEKTDEFSFVNLKIDTTEDFKVTVSFFQVFDRYVFHAFLPP